MTLKSNPENSDGWSDGTVIREVARRNIRDGWLVKTENGVKRRYIPAIVRIYPPSRDGEIISAEEQIRVLEKKDNNDNKTKLEVDF